MEGGHSRGRRLKDVVVGSKAEAATRRRRAQQGVAAAGRRGQAVQLARAERADASKTKKDKAIAKEVERAMQQGTGLVQAALEHLDTAERSWDRFVKMGGHTVDGYPSEVLVVTYMSTISRERQRMCLAQRGKRRKGVQKNAVRNYVAEMANNLWATKYPLFGKLSVAEQRAYWSKIFGAYKAMYASASAPAATEEEEERAEQLVAQTEEDDRMGMAGSKHYTTIPASRHIVCGTLDGSVSYGEDALPSMSML